MDEHGKERVLKLECARKTQIEMEVWKRFMLAV